MHSNKHGWFELLDGHTCLLEDVIIERQPLATVLRYDIYSNLLVKISAKTLVKP